MILTSTNIDSELKKIRIHDHCCFIYETEQEWRAAVIPFLLQGLICGEKCVYVVNNRSESYICECLVSAGADVEVAINSGQLLFLHTVNLFAGDDDNNIEHVLNLYTKYLELFMAEGYSVIRISSEPLYRFFDYESDGKFLELQLRLNRDIFPRYPLLTLCQYHRREDHPMILRDAIISSSCLFRRGYIYRNPIQISSEIYFPEKDTGWEAEYWMRTQETLMESEEKYRLIVENGLDMITIIDPESYNFLYVNPMKYKILGYSPNELIAQSVLAFIHPEQQENIINAFQEGIRQGSGELIYSIRKKDGSYLWMEGKGKLIRTSSGHDEIILFSRDIHEKKLAEEALWESQQNYKNQLIYLNTLIDTMNEFCVTYDKNNVLTFVNQRLLETLGFRLEEMLGKSILDFIPVENRESVRRQIDNRLQNGEVSSHENALICKDGSVLLVKLKGSPILENEKIIGGLVLAEDITQQRRLEREMARLGQLNTVGEIAASIGHEIRNPMTTVQGFLQIMSRNEDFKDHQADFDLMLEELGRANSIITEFLALAKDKLVDLQCYNINKIVETLAPLLVADAINGDKYISFILNNVPNLLLDEKEIRQLILNLVRNAIEATAAGGVISLKTYREENQVVLSVVDQGEGIPDDILDKLGTPFFTTKEQGTGLGLAVCFSIAARHNAKLDFKSSLEGSTFMVRFSLPEERKEIIAGAN